MKKGVSKDSYGPWGLLGQLSPRHVDNNTNNLLLSNNFQTNQKQCLYAKYY